MRSSARHCGNCGQEGHLRPTCGRRSTYRPPLRARVPAGVVVHELTGEEAERILAPLRELVPITAAHEAPARFLDALMLSCYLRGLLVGDDLARRREETPPRP